MHRGPIYMFHACSLTRSLVPSTWPTVSCEQEKWGCFKNKIVAAYGIRLVFNNNDHDCCLDWSHLCPYSFTAVEMCQYLTLSLSLYLSLSISLSLSIKPHTTPMWKFMKLTQLIQLQARLIAKSVGGLGCCHLPTQGWLLVWFVCKCSRSAYKPFFGSKENYLGLSSNVLNLARRIITARVATVATQLPSWVGGCNACWGAWMLHAQAWFWRSQYALRSALFLPEAKMVLV